MERTILSKNVYELSGSHLVSRIQMTSPTAHLVIFPVLKHLLDWRGQKWTSCEVAVHQRLPRVRDPDVALEHA